MPRKVVESILDLRGRATTAEDSRVLPTVADVTGAPARTFRQWAADHADAFR
jgi:(4-alkanoyl-5-oxo-2,5-dihydrofuran-3-yl)methyl phosphate reductase